MEEDYTKLRLIGKGTFGQVWLVREEKTSRKYVIKQIEINSTDGMIKDKCLSEVKILSKMKHLNIIKYKDVFLRNYENKHLTLNIVMEYAENGDLDQKIKERKGKSFDENVIMNYFVQIVFGIMYIHSQRILHRDLKSQNIFITSGNIVKVGDFGISKALNSSKELASTAIGTPYYLPPEICLGKSYGFSSDIWSLGCILYEMARLEKPFLAENLQSLIRKIVCGNFEPIPNHYSLLVGDLVSIMLKQNAAERPTARELLKIPNLLVHVKKYTGFYERYKRSKSFLNAKSRTNIVRLHSDSDVLGAKKRPLGISESLDHSKNSKETRKRLYSLQGSKTFVFREKNQSRNSNVEGGNLIPQNANIQNELEYELTDVLKCKNCFFQYEWDNRLYGNIKEEMRKVEKDLESKLGTTLLETAVAYLSEFWEERNSNPTKGLIKILGKSNLKSIPRLMKLISMKMNFKRQSM